MEPPESKTAHTAPPPQAELARLKGLEPLAHCLEGSCSIHLSYRRIWSG